MSDGRQAVAVCLIDAASRGDRAQLPRGVFAAAGEALGADPLLFERPAGAKSRSTIALGTSAEGLLGWQRHLAAELGKEPARVDHEVSWSIYFEDPDGNPYEITTYEYDALA